MLYDAHGQPIRRQAGFTGRYITGASDSGREPQADCLGFADQSVTEEPMEICGERTCSTD